VDQLDEVQVRWPDGKVTLLKEILTDQLLTLKWEEAVDPPLDYQFFPALAKPIFTKTDAKSILEFTHP
jgi:hypothetical protein